MLPDAAVQAPLMQGALYVGTLMGALSGCSHLISHMRCMRSLLMRCMLRGRCISAGTKEMDLLGCTVVALVTSTGGGTLRDLVLDIPVYWIPRYEHLVLSIGVAVFTFLIWPAIFASGFKSTHLTFLWSDAIGMAASTVIGAHIGLQVRRESTVRPISI